MSEYQTIEQIESRLEALREEYKNGTRSRIGITLEAKCLKIALEIKKTKRLF